MDLPDAAQLTGQRLHEASSIGGRNLGRTPRLRMTLTYPPSSPRLPSLSLVRPRARQPNAPA